LRHDAINGFIVTRGERKIEGPPVILFAPDEAITVAAVRALRAGVALLKHHEAGTLAGEVEPVHQFRVTIRRLRAAIELLVGVLHGSRLSYYRSELPFFGHSAGAVRDCDALAELVRHHAAELDPGIARALIPAYQTLADRRVAALRETGQLIRSPRYARLIERLNNPLARRLPDQTTVAQMAPAMLRPIVSSAVRVGARLTEGSPPPAFHRLRIRLKRVRYAFEMLDPLSGKQAAKALKRLRRMQEVLGEQQDLVTTAAWMRQFARQPMLTGETLLAAGAMLQLASERREKVAAAAWKRWNKLRDSAILSKALKEFAEMSRIRMLAVSGAEGGDGA
jgi:CHAD domain-containing protein